MNTNNPTPEPVGEVPELTITEHGRGCTCQSCGNEFRVDFRLEDDLWAKVRVMADGRRLNVMCGSCIAQRVETLSGFGFDYYDIYHGSKYGDKVGALECELESARAAQPATANLLTPEERDLVIGAIPLQALPAFRNTKEAMEYAARHKMPAVVPVATPTDTEERIQRAAQSIWNNLDRTWSVGELIDVIAAEFK